MLEMTNMLAERHMRRVVICHGFSLIELMVVLAIAAILLSIGAPAFGELIQRQKIITAANEFIAAIHLTRSEAVQRGTRVDLVPVDGDWDNGWLVFVDGDGNQKPDEGEQVIYMHGAVPAGMTITSVLTDSGGTYLAYNGTGRTRTNVNPLQPQYGSFRFRLDKEKRNIVINMLGRTRVCTPKADEESC